MKKRNFIRNIGTMLFIAIVVFFQLINIFFGHFHYVNGKMIYHAHPFKQDDNSKTIHIHTQEELISIFLLNSTILLVTFFIFLKAINSSFILKRIEEPVFNYIQIFLSNNNYRSPPAFC